MAAEPDYYDLLQVSPKAESEVIDAAYRRLARRYHPDVNPSPAAQRRMRQLNRALEVLSDPGKRAAYDRRRQQLLAERTMATKPPTIAIPTSAKERPAKSIRERLRRAPGTLLAICGGLAIAFATIALGVILLSDSDQDAPSTEEPRGTVTSPVAEASGEQAAQVSGTFSNGTWLVGEEMAPGLWRAIRPRTCTWKRLASIEGETDIVAAAGSYLTVELLATDAAFETDGCGWWTQILTPPSATPTDPFGSGTWLVPGEIAPGKWRNSDSSQGCSWAMLSSLGGEPSAVIASGFTESTGTMELVGRERAFHSWNCGTWTRIGD